MFTCENALNQNYIPALCANLIKLETPAAGRLAILTVYVSGKKINTKSYKAKPCRRCRIKNMLRKTALVPGEWYHLYNRGTDRREIFATEKDYERFLRLIYLCNSSSPADLKLQGETLYDATLVDRGETLVDLAAYCLMPNHFHFLVREKAEGNISRFMQKLTTGYTMYFNKRHERSGALFQGVFKSQHAKDDRYFKYVISYIHLNPVKLIEPKWKETGINNKDTASDYLREYRYSSYPDYTGKNRLEGILINQPALNEFMPTPKSFEASVTDWLSHQPLQGETL